MKLVIAGANGFLGRSLARYFSFRGHEVVGLVRQPTESNYYRAVVWDGVMMSGWVADLDGTDVLINLAGRSVNCRYDVRNRAEILESRRSSTRILGEALALCDRPPQVWINSSTATIYRHAMDRPQDEIDGEIGAGFSVEVAKAWEKTFFAARVPGTVRKVAIRTAMVLAKEPGTALDYLLRLAKWGLGGRMASGRQMVSWIHLGDFCRAIEWLITHPECDGIVNLAAPGPVTNRELMGEVRAEAGVPIGLPAAGWMLKLGAVAMRTETELILKSRWVLPSRLAAHGFRFRWPRLRGALADLVQEKCDRRVQGARNPGKTMKKKCPR